MLWYPTNYSMSLLNAHCGATALVCFGLECDPPLCIVGSGGLAIGSTGTFPGGLMVLLA